MQDITTLLNECYSAFSQTEEYRILKTYRTRDNRLTFDERFAINKSIERTYAPVFELLRADAPSLTESDLFFCALTFQHIETVAIAECLTVTKDAIRMRKLRLREKLPNKWFDLLFPEQKRNGSDSVTSQNSAEKTAPITLPTESTKNAKVMKEKMSFGNAVASCFSKYFTTNGRARRSEYWFFYLFTVIISLCYVILNNIFKGLAYPVWEETTVDLCNTAMTVFYWVLEVVLLIPFFTVTVRRLHDRDDNGWLAILLCLFPNILKAIMFFFVEGEGKDFITSGDLSPNEMAGIVAPMILFMLFWKAILIIRIVLFCKSGTEGPNAYGPDPIRIISQSDRQ